MASLTIANMQQCQGPRIEDLVPSVASWEMLVRGKPLMQRSVGCQILPLLLLGCKVTSPAGSCLDALPQPRL